MSNLIQVPPPKDPGSLQSGLKEMFMKRPNTYGAIAAVLVLVFGAASERPEEPPIVSKAEQIKQEQRASEYAHAKAVESSKYISDEARDFANSVGRTSPEELLKMDASIEEAKAMYRHLGLCGTAGDPGCAKYER